MFFECTSDRIARIDCAPEFFLQPFRAPDLYRGRVLAKPCHIVSSLPYVLGFVALPFFDFGRILFLSPVHSPVSVGHLRLCLHLFFCHGIKRHGGHFWKCAFLQSKSACFWLREFALSCTGELGCMVMCEARLYLSFKYCFKHLGLGDRPDLLQLENPHRGPRPSHVRRGIVLVGISLALIEKCWQMWHG